MTLTSAAKEHSFLAGMNGLQVAKLMALSHEVRFKEN